jgi:hypothetical protein
VSDPALPQYINDTCSFVQDHQNYMFYGWPDLELFQWFWKSDGFDLPRFNTHRFLEVVINKKIAFLGNSLARNHFQTLLYLLSKVLASCH